jgi:hypothetical protein
MLIPQVIVVPDSAPQHSFNRGGIPKMYSSSTSPASLLSTSTQQQKEESGKAPRVLLSVESLVSPPPSSGSQTSSPTLSCSPSSSVANSPELFASVPLVDSENMSPPSPSFQVGNYRFSRFHDPIMPTAEFGLDFEL